MIMAEMEKHLPVSINVINQTGGVAGSNGMVYVMNQPDDGYTLVGLSESNVTAAVQGGWDQKFSFWHPFIVGGSPDLISVPANSPYDTIEDLVAAARDNPGLDPSGGERRRLDPPSQPAGHREGRRRHLQVRALWGLGAGAGSRHRGRGRPRRDLSGRTGPADRGRRAEAAGDADARLRRDRRHHDPLRLRQFRRAGASICRSSRPSASPSTPRRPMT
jgi:hypothetical protein